MPVTPSGKISLVQETLRVTLANSAAMQTWLGVASASAALTKIHHNALPAPASGGEHTAAELQAYRPFAIVSTYDAGGWTSRADSMGTSFGWADRGSLWCALEQDVTAGVSASDVELGFANSVGAIVADIQALAGTAPYLASRSIEVELYRCPVEYVPDQGDHVVAILKIEWGGA